MIILIIHAIIKEMLSILLQGSIKAEGLYAQITTVRTAGDRGGQVNVKLRRRFGGD